MKIYNNVYKKLLVVYLSIFIFYIEAIEEEAEKSIQQTVKKITRRDSKGIEKLELLIKQKTVSILNALAIDFDILTNRLVYLENNLAMLALLVNNLSIEIQLGLIYTSVASPILKTPLVVIDSGSEVVTYNNDIKTALAAVSIALNIPSKNNTFAAQSALTIAIEDFDVIMIYDNFLAINSPYSISDIYAALIQLNAQLAYLYSLQ